MIKQQQSPLINQLALITGLRDVFSQEERVPAAEALAQTSIMEILARILGFQSSEVGEELYFMKLESLWILINLSMCDSEETQLILQSNFSQAPAAAIDKAQFMQSAAQDLVYGRSLIL